MIALDSSVSVRVLLEDAELHAEALAVMAERPWTPAHALLETFVVVTRLPDRDRVAAEVATHILRANFGDRVLPMVAPGEVAAWLERMTAVGIAGAAIHDALIAESARAAGATLFTADRRAAKTYQAVGVAVEFIGE